MPQKPTPAISSSQVTAEMPFGEWTVIAAGTKRRHHLCRCQCGREKNVATYSLVSGLSKSCGKCKPVPHQKPATELLKSRGYPELVHCNTKHGMSSAPEYWTWRSMLARCRNPKTKNYHRYGGRGIQVCTRWSDFESFLEDMGRRPEVARQSGRSVYSIERCDTGGHYNCGKCSQCLANGWTANCRWATTKEQCRNKDNNSLIEFGGRACTAPEWAEILGVSVEALKSRIHKGWSIERTLTTPINTSKRNSRAKARTNLTLGDSKS